jgi:hypothetical protein
MQLTTHVSPSKLWQCACGAVDLAWPDYEHVFGCPDCEKLITEIAEALDDIANRWPNAGGAEMVSAYN